MSGSLSADVATLVLAIAALSARGPIGLAAVASLLLLILNLPGLPLACIFAGLFSNPWLLAAVMLSLLLHVAVVYVPFLQKAFSTVSLSGSDWLRCAAVGSSVLWLTELAKLVLRSRMVAGRS